MLRSLVEVSASADAAAVLGLSPGLADLAEANTRIGVAPAARADRIYTGVLYDALGFATLSAAAKRRATGRIVIMSSLFGALSPGDRIPPYRLSGGVNLPGLGPVASFWRSRLDAPLTSKLGSGLLVDLRSTTYAAFWRAAPAAAHRVVTVRVLHEAGNTRTVVSHFNKATKGRLVRDLLEDGVTPRTPDAFARALTRLGWRVEVHGTGPHGTALDVVVNDPIKGR
jgi:uncharacterized protein